ncbi:MAG: hypothetical protein ABH878_04375 [bacterium]
MKRVLQMVTLAAVVSGLLVGSSSALLPDFSKEELITNAEGIVLGQVRDLRCAWNEDHSQIFTYVTVAVEEQLKGSSSSSEILVQIPGGTVGEITLTVTDTPTLERGMRVILHTFFQDTGYLWIYGWEKGALVVENNAIPVYQMTVDQFRQLVQSVQE